MCQCVCVSLCFVCGGRNLLVQEVLSVFYILWSVKFQCLNNTLFYTNLLDVCNVDSISIQAIKLQCEVSK